MRTFRTYLLNFTLIESSFEHVEREGKVRAHKERSIPATPTDRDIVLCRVGGSLRDIENVCSQFLRKQFLRIVVLFIKLLA